MIDCQNYKLEKFFKKKKDGTIRATTNFKSLVFLIFLIFFASLFLKKHNFTLVYLTVKLEKIRKNKEKSKCLGAQLWNHSRNGKKNTHCIFAI